MLGTVDHIDYDGEHVRHVELRFPSRADPSGEVVMNVETLERIGRGSFGTVYRARCTHHPKLALKISTGKATRLRLELEVLAKVCTKGRLLLPRFEFGALNKSADLMVVGMELCVPSTLHDFLLSTKLTHEADLLFMAHQAAQAVAYVHEDGCIHRDVKLQNFVFDQLGNLKLIDFGLASNTMDPSAGDVVAGTVSFMPPEMAHNALHRDRRVSVGAAGDVWSMGIVFFSIFTQRNPYAAATAELEAARRPARSRSRSNANNVGGEGEDASATSAKATQNPVEANHQLLDVVRQAKWRWPDGCRLSADVRKLVESILIMDAKQRPTMAEVLKSTVWRRRSRTPPAAVVNYLGITDDMFFSADDAPLLRAVEQRSADVAASLANNRPHPTEEDGHEKDAQDEDDAMTKRGSLQVVATDSADVHVYDVRCSARKTSKPIRDISKVIEEETSKPANKTRSRSRRARANNTSSTSRGASMRRKESEDDDDDDDEDDTEEAVRSLQASLTEELLMTQNTSRPTSRSASASRLAHETTGMRSAATASTPPRNDRSNSDEVSAANVYDDEKAALPRSLSGSICLVAENEDDDDAHAHLQIASTSAPPPLKISIAATTMDHHPEDASARMSLHDPFAQACTSSLPAVANRTTSPGMSFNTKKHMPSQRPNKTTITNNKPSSSSSSFKPFSAAVPHNMAMTDLLLDEIAARMELGGVLFLEHQWLLASLRLTIEEDQERYNITWLAEEQAKSASHPHHFKELRDITNTKKYRFGFVCDLCDYEFLPTTDRQRRLKLHFFHCACGRDLCPECYEDFRQSCTCVCCEEVHLNHHVLREHLKKTMLPRVSAASGGRRSVAAAAVAPAPPGSRKAPPPRNRKRRGDDDDDDEEEDFEDSDADEVEEPQQRPRQLPRAAAAKAQASPPTKLSLAAMRQQRQPAASSSTPTPTPPPAQDRRAAHKRERESGGFDRPIDVPDGPWRPFDRHRDEGRPTPLQPTAEERERILNGEWIRYSYLYTNTGEGVMQDTDDSEPVALVYHIQPGRHGAIFLNSGYSMHSAILSMMSRQLFVVDRADVGTGEDATRLSTLVAAKSHADLAPAFHTLHAIVGHDSNMMKQRRVPGRVSVYQAPRSAYSCGRGDPFLYVRWFRFNEDRSIGAFLLSNGAMQVLVGDEYELRWFEDERRYLVRCNGVCEVVDEERFPLAEEINHLLYDALDGENEEGSAGSSEFQ